ncbi:hypothetical protein [Mastigocoleus testarum]|uniref:Uncharacterized protein n=1 Tax=Mastigocoleus testarum BC008 TaxID=371196 RepID=A0A0V7ZLA6_9CYAN|nr:hypothetical protein [Mastigocoleus testarum]KST65265.1 hypothetical protein BC008_20965 [Mastigocoleus testarum BC008]KST68946.1 hypothetical protein BC008_02410 [Mastigocoleus testarum BC008]
MTRFILLAIISVSVLLIAPYVGYARIIKVKGNKPHFIDFKGESEEKWENFEQGELRERRKEGREYRKERRENRKERRDEFRENREESFE